MLGWGLVLGSGETATTQAFSNYKASNSDNNNSDNSDLALTPPMGWNGWNKFQCDGLNEDIVKQVTASMVTNGMRAAGYQYINLDDCWQSSRDNNGTIVADIDKFPSGIKALADYVHSKGFKFGLYTDAGLYTCAGKPGSLNHYQQDANTYASWGVDYVKVDWCYNKGLDAQTQYTQFRDALKNSGRNILFGICTWGAGDPWIWGPSVGNSWRSTGDIKDSWTSITKIVDAAATYGPSVEPGSWNDPDMLEVGNGGMNNTEYTAHFSLWALMAAPLMAGNDVRNMSNATQAILTNAEVIAVDQDAAGITGSKVWDNGNGLQVWSKALATSGQRAVVLFNRNDTKTSITAKWSDIGLAAGSATVRDLWAHTDLGAFSNSFTAKVPAHGVVMVKISGSETDAVSYEAEANTNSLGGGAAIVSCATCSGGTKVGSIGNNANTLQFNTININQSGSHLVTIYYGNGDSNRIAFVSVNGASGIPINFNSTSGSFDNIGKKIVSLNLKAGNNTIKFYSSFGWSPDIDRLTIQDSSVAANPIVNGATYAITVKHSGFAVEVFGGTTNNGALIDQSPYLDNQNQQWLISNVGSGADGTYKIINKHSGKALVVQGAATTVGVPIIQYTYSSGDTPNDEWMLQDIGDGYFQIINKYSNLALELHQATQAAGTKFQQGYQDNIDTQKFLLTRVYTSYGCVWAGRLSCYIAG
jgi:alpha-galactosidase